MFELTHYVEDTCENQDRLNYVVLTEKECCNLAESISVILEAAKSLNGPQIQSVFAKARGVKFNRVYVGSDEQGLVGSPNPSENHRVPFKACRPKAHANTSNGPLPVAHSADFGVTKESLEGFHSVRVCSSPCRVGLYSRPSHGHYAECDIPRSNERSRHKKNIHAMNASDTPGSLPLINQILSQVNYHASCLAKDANRHQFLSHSEPAYCTASEFDDDNATCCSVSSTECSCVSCVEANEEAPSSVSSHVKPSSRKSPEDRKRRRIEREPPRIGSHKLGVMLLKACRFGKSAVSLSDHQVQVVLHAATYFVPQYCRPRFKSNLAQWRYNKFQGLHVLGLPPIWKGAEAAAKYINLLASHQITDAVSRFCARLLLFMNYHELCGDSRKNQSLMLDAIANAYYGISSQGTVKQRRDFVTGHMRLGRWCWRLAGTVGVGVSLTFGDKLMTLMVNHKFTNAQIDALVTYVSNTHPGTVRLLHRLESIAKPLILGELPMDLIEEIQNNRSSILGECELSHAITDDETALVSQLRERPWTVIDSNFLAIKKIAEFLRGL